MNRTVIVNAQQCLLKRFYIHNDIFDISTDVYDAKHCGLPHAIMGFDCI